MYCSYLSSIYTLSLLQVCFLRFAEVLYKHEKKYEKLRQKSKAEKNDLLSKKYAKAKRNTQRKRYVVNGLNAALTCISSYHIFKYFSFRKKLWRPSVDTHVINSVLDDDSSQQPLDDRDLEVSNPNANSQERELPSDEELLSGPLFVNPSPRAHFPRLPSYFDQVNVKVPVRIDNAHTDQIMAGNLVFCLRKEIGLWREDIAFDKFYINAQIPGIISEMLDELAVNTVRDNEPKMYFLAQNGSVFFAQIINDMVQKVRSTLIPLDPEIEYTLVPQYEHALDACPEVDPGYLSTATKEAVQEAIQGEEKPSCPVCLDTEGEFKNKNSFTVASLGCLKPHLICKNCKAACDNQLCPLCRTHFKEHASNI